MCRITLYSLNKDDDTHIPNLIAMNLRVHSFFLPSFLSELRRAKENGVTDIHRIFEAAKVCK